MGSGTGKVELLDLRGGERAIINPNIVDQTIKAAIISRYGSASDVKIA